MTTFQQWNAQLREDVNQIAMVASAKPTEAEQIDRIQHIAMAAAYCLAHRMGPLAAAYWLKQVSDQVRANGRGDVH